MVCFVILITLSVLFFIISVCAGSVQIPLSDIWRQFRGEQDELYAAILFQIRIPRTFAAILLGGALALSGYLLRGMREGKWNRIIFAPTGALLSPTTTFQGESIPGICHAVVFSNHKEG